ncbi:hypothetical protein ScPMuIL_011217 [Solemya velum]
MASDTKKRIDGSRNRGPDGESADTRLIVVAIDFGTTFSGYAFSIRSEFVRDPMSIKTIHWKGNKSGSYKIPTALLLEGTEVHSFGYAAELKYNELLEDEEDAGWHFFRHFKMELYEKDVDLKMTLEVDGGSTLAIDIFSDSLAHLKNHFLEEKRTTYPDILETDIHWVITVPAIWNDAAKQFMREAAIRAGIEDNHITLALEPEVASIYCKMLPLQRKTDESGFDIIAKFDVGHKYLIADLGGGTADMTVHQVGGDNKLHEIHRASGGDWGGMKVDQKFLEILSTLFGKDTLNNFKENARLEFFELKKAFHIWKTTIGTEVQSSRISIPGKFIEMIERSHTDSINEIVEKSVYKGKIKWKKTKLELGEKGIDLLFRETVDEIGNHIDEILSNSKCADVGMILLVGGFSQSPYVHRILSNRFIHLNVIVPPDPELSVLKGAVLYGHDPNIVTQRVCRRTYGIALHEEFIKGEHRDDKRVVIDGATLCKDIFHCICHP